MRLSSASPFSLLRCLSLALSSGLSGAAHFLCSAEDDEDDGDKRMRERSRLLKGLQTSHAEDDNKIPLQYKDAGDEDENR